MNTYIQLFERAFQGNNIYPTILFLGIVTKWTIDFFSKNPQLLNYIVLKQYRFKKIESHSKLIESLKYIDDENLDHIHQDILKKETFEKVTGIKSFGTKKRELFLKIYPMLRKEYGFEEIYQLRSHLLTRKDSLYVIGRLYYIIQDILFALILGLSLFGLFGIISLYFTKSLWGDSTIWWMSLLVFIGFMIIRIDTSVKASKLRVILKKHYGAVS